MSSVASAPGLPAASPDSKKHTTIERIFEMMQ